MPPKPQVTNPWLAKIKKMEGAIVASELHAKTVTIMKTPSPSLNWAIGGGFARGKVVVAYGPESAGKTLLALLMVIEAQLADPNCICFWYDAEFSFNTKNFIRMGGDPDRLVIYRTNAIGQKYINPKGEEKLGVFQHIVQEVIPMAQAGCPIGMLVVDSVKMLRGPKEIEWTKKNGKDNGIGKVNMGNDGVAALGQAFKATVEFFNSFDVPIFLIQQVNQEMDQDKVKYQGKKWNVPSGQVLKHFADYMVLVERVERKDSKEFADSATNIDGANLQLGHTIRVTVEKNRIAGNPGRKAEFFFRYNQGVTSQGAEVAKLAEALGVMKHGLTAEGKENIKSWTWDGGPTPAIIGKENAAKVIMESPEIQEQLMKLINGVSAEDVKKTSLFDASILVEDVPPDVVAE